MSDEDNNKGDPDPNLKPDEDKTLNEEIKFEDDELGLMEEEQSKKIKTMSFQKARFRELYHKEKDEREKEKKEWETKLQAFEKKPDKKDKKDSADVEAERFELIELKQDNPDITRENILKAQRLAKAEGITTAEMIKSEYFQAYLEKVSAKAAADGATPPPSGRTGQREISFENIIKNPKLYKDLPKEKREAFVKWKQENYPDA